MKTLRIKTTGGGYTVPVKTTAGKGSVNLRDILRGLLIAALTPVIVLIQQSLDAGQLVFNVKALGMAAIGGGLAYIVKNVFSPAQVIIKQKDLPD
jgi:hypothetical protein